MVRCPFRLNSLPPYYAQADGNCYGNGTDDDAALLEAAMDAALAAGKHLYLEAGTYLVSTHITPPSGLTMRGAGDTSIVKRVDPDDWTARVIIYLSGTSNVSIKNLELLSTSQGSNAHMIGISAVNSSGLLLDGVTFSTMYEAMHTDTAASYFTVQNCTTVDVKQGFFLRYFTNGTFYNCNIALSSQAPHSAAWPHHFYIAEGVSGCTFDTITMSNGVTGTYYYACQPVHIYPSGAGNLTFTNITFSEIRVCPIYLEGTTGPVTFDGVTGSTTVWEGADIGTNMWIWLEGVDYFSIKNFAIAGDTTADDYLCYCNTTGAHNTIEGTSTMSSSLYTGATHGCYIPSGKVKPTIVGSVTVT